MAKFRFKTEQEFKEDGNWSDVYNCPTYWAFTKEMNKYLGQDVPESHEYYCERNETFSLDGWSFKNDEYKLKEQKYERTLVHCKTQEEWDFAVIKLGRASTVEFKKIGDSMELSNANSSYMYDSNKHRLTWKFYSFEEWCKEFGHVYKEDLSGRYLKALVDRPLSIPIQKGYIARVKKENILDEITTNKGIKFTGLTYNHIGTHWELLPKDYVPLSSSTNAVVYKVGDTVRIVKRNKGNVSGIVEGWGLPNGNVGEIGKIECELSNGFRVVRLSDDAYLGIFKEQEIEHCKGATITETSEEMVQLTFDKPQDFNNTKIWIGNDPKLSTQVQEVMFKKGYSWSGRNKTVSHTSSGSLYFERHSICHMPEHDRKKYFDSHKHREIYPSDIGITPTIGATATPVREVSPLELSSFPLEGIKLNKEDMKPCKELVGRWLKYISKTSWSCLSNRPEIGGYVQITREHTNTVMWVKGTDHKALMNYDRWTSDKHFELMPEGFSPPLAVKKEDTTRRTRNGKELQNFIIGEWYTCPTPTWGYKYVRVKSAEQKKISFSDPIKWYTVITFDKAISKDGKTDILISKGLSNIDMEENMQHVSTNIATALLNQFFIVGKWYKNLGSSRNYIAKAISTSRMEGTRFYHGEYITEDGKFEESPYSKTNLDWNSNTVECTLEEIQKFLPEGHVDKIAVKATIDTQLKIGKWYHSTIWTAGSCAKLASPIKDDFKYSERRYSTGSYNKEVGSWCGGGKYTLVSQEVLDSFLPEGHPDRIPTLGVYTPDALTSYGSYAIGMDSAYEEDLISPEDQKLLDYATQHYSIGDEIERKRFKGGNCDTVIIKENTTTASYNIPHLFAGNNVYLGYHQIYDKESKSWAYNLSRNKRMRNFDTSFIVGDTVKVNDVTCNCHGQEAKLISIERPEYRGSYPYKVVKDGREEWAAKIERVVSSVPISSDVSAKELMGKSVIYHDEVTKVIGWNGSSTVLIARDIGWKMDSSDMKKYNVSSSNKDKLVWSTDIEYLKLIKKTSIGLQTKGVGKVVLPPIIIKERRKTKK